MLSSNIPLTLHVTEYCTALMRSWRSQMPI